VAVIQVARPSDSFFSTLKLRAERAAHVLKQLREHSVNLGVARRVMHVISATRLYGTKGRS